MDRKDKPAMTPIEAAMQNLLKKANSLSLSWESLVPQIRWAKSLKSYRRIASKSYRCDSNR